MARTLGGVVGAALIGLALVLAAGVLQLGSPALVLFALPLVVFALLRIRLATKATSVVRSLLAAAAIIGFAGRLVAYWFTRSSYDRYIWVIHQQGPCAYLGSGSVGFGIALASVLTCVGALGMLLGTRAVPDPLFPRPGIYLGVLVVLLGSLLVIPEPPPFARLIGCLQ